MQFLRVWTRSLPFHVLKYSFGTLCLPTWGFAVVIFCPIQDQLHRTINSRYDTGKKNFDFVFPEKIVPQARLTTWRRKTSKSFSDLITQCLIWPEIDTETSVEDSKSFSDSSMTRIEQFRVVDRGKPSLSFPHLLANLKCTFSSSMDPEFFEKNLILKVFHACVISSVYCSTISWIVFLVYHPMSVLRNRKRMSTLPITCYLCSFHSYPRRSPIDLSDNRY